MGPKTTLWTTFGRGTQPKHEDEVSQRAIFIHGDQPKRFEIPVSEYLAFLVTELANEALKQSEPALQITCEGLIPCYVDIS